VIAAAVAVVVVVVVAVVAEVKNDARIQQIYVM
jgi:hypothetical protein